MKLENYEKEHLDLVKNTAAECTLFLKQDGSFPLKEAKTIAAYGSGVRRTVKGGTGSGEVNSRFSVNIEEGLTEAGFEIISRGWLDAYELELKNAKAQFLKELKAEAKAAHANLMMYGMGKTMLEPEYTLPLDTSADAAIYVLARNSGEGNDRQVKKGDVLLTDTEVRDILYLNENYDKFMLVLNVGGPVDLSPVADVKNILVLSQLGVVTGYVLSDILLGKANPSGKLSTSWSAWEDYCTIGDFGDPDDTYYKEGIYVGYRYFDTVGKKAMFPFGFGLSYTSFEIGESDIKNSGQEITVTTTVKNTGAIAGKEVVEVYLSAPAGKLGKPYQDLVGFAKTKEIGAGDSDKVSISFNLSDFASYDEKKESFILERGLYLIRVGNSSVNTTIAAAISLADDIITIKTRNCLGKVDFSDYLPETAQSLEIPANLPTINISSADIPTNIISHDRDYPIDDIIKNLSNEDLAYMHIGSFDPKARGLSVIGNASFAVAGAAGETTTLFKNRGIKSMVMADGPAGLRLSKEYFVDEKGVHGMGGGLPESMTDLMGGFTSFLMKLLSKSPKPKAGTEIKEQYATAIPIGTAIAQSFNYDLAVRYGDIVGNEMERFKVQLWLAPALNIHRSILCGRNFEYYSEDPLVSGLMAAAITEGVQKHKGCGTTIKHYAANNAETNRYASNSHVSERAMREIYLRGFGICVKKSQPHAIMTSYNLLNGVHTAEHRGLIEDILRDEYGFEGIVMTDWTIAMMTGKTKYRGSLSAEVAKAGGDLFMPGSQADYNGLLAALKDGSLSRKQAEENATRVYRMAENC